MGDRSLNIEGKKAIGKGGTNLYIKRVSEWINKWMRFTLDRRVKESLSISH